MTAAWSGLEKLPDMDDGQFARWNALLEKRTGMLLPDERRSFLVTSLAIRMREIGYTDYKAYYDFVRSRAAGAVEWAILVDRLTVHETRFFRHTNSVKFIREHFLPAWAQDRPAPLSLHIWSVGCATGEEPYTLAMVADDFLGALGREYYLGVTASDISLASLAVGRGGVYHKRKLAGVEPALRETYFNKLNAERFEVKETLRSRVCFAQLNVLEMQKAPIGAMDLIFCQNLLIYFDRDRRVTILDELATHLLPGGMLILGAGEIMNWRAPGLERIRYNDTLAYQRRQT